MRTHLTESVQIEPYTSIWAELERTLSISSSSE
jgi:hypothetical protein